MTVTTPTAAAMFQSIRGPGSPAQTTPTDVVFSFTGFSTRASEHKEADDQHEPHRPSPALGCPQLDGRGGGVQGRPGYPRGAGIGGSHKGRGVSRGRSQRRI